ncbi:sporulation protein Cse60 [Lentibacillus sp. N15]|uniref:sporulation protein Cse60 n=1 Tax=Lentibacillus songyuanensis TaxID=3136161 RepID=UPI0031BB142D
MKTFSSMSEKGLDKKINDFLSDTPFEIVDVKFSISIFSYSAMVIYKEKIY